MAAVTDTDSQSQHVAHSHSAMRCWSIVNVLCALALSVHWHQAHVGKHVLLINMFDAQNVRVFFCFNSTASFFFSFALAVVYVHTASVRCTHYILLLFIHMHTSHVAVSGRFSRFSSCSFAIRCRALLGRRVFRSPNCCLFTLGSSARI